MRLVPMAQIYERYLADDIEGARAIYAAILPVLVAKGANLQMFIQSAKHLLVRAGAIEHATVRAAGNGGGRSVAA